MVLLWVDRLGLPTQCPAWDGQLRSAPPLGDVHGGSTNSWLLFPEDGFRLSLEASPHSEKGGVGLDLEFSSLRSALPPRPRCARSCLALEAGWLGPWQGLGISPGPAWPGLRREAPCALHPRLSALG